VHSLTANRTLMQMHLENAAEAGGVIIRQALPADAEALVDLCREHAEFERSDYEVDGKASRLSAALFSSAPRLYAWVAVVSRNPIGYATASREYSTWGAREYLHMDCLFVRAQHRGAGVGAALLDSVVQFARAYGLNEVQWQTPDWNVDASRFYRRLGGVGQPKLRFVLHMAQNNCGPRATACD
jgi:GNAT superfamily N-acetyltransferase